ncbi:MAG: SGNH/GDSL hydrolase N-terminal domain-containing protein, partial [Planctomycetaceae bacterium]
MPRRIARLIVLLGLCLFTVPVAAGEAVSPDLARRGSENGVLWYDATLLTLEGQGWNDTESEYDRLPARAKGSVREAVWSLSRQSAGLCVRFVTEATELHARWTLTSPRLDMAHMPATGVSGLDLYVKTDGRWRWLACARPAAQSNT